MAYFRQILTPNSPIRNHLYPIDSFSIFSFLPIYCQGESRCFSLPCASRLKQGLRSEGGRTHRFDWAKWGRQRWGRDPLNQKHRFKPTRLVSRGARWNHGPPFPEAGSGRGKGVLRRPGLFSEKGGGGRSAVVENLGSIFLFGTLNIIYVCPSCKLTTVKF